MLFKKKEKPEIEIPMHEAVIRSLLIDDVGYVLCEAKIYKSKAELWINVVKEKEDGFHDVQKKKVTIARSEETSVQPFEFEGHILYWDYNDMTFRHRPDYDKTKRNKINEYLHIVDDKVVWVNKKYAEINLSPLCLEYAYDDGEGNYLWNIDDNSHYTVFTEFFGIVIDYKNKKDNMGEIFRDIANNASTYACRYYRMELDPNYLIDYENNKDKWFILKNYDVKKAYNRKINEIND